MGASASAIVAISAANNASANAAAHAARVDRCKTVIDNFDSRGASVAQMQEYAGCVDTVYPQEMTGGEVLGLKALFILAIVGMVIGFFWGKREGYVGDIIFGGFMGFFLLPIAALAVYAFGYGVMWLFN